MTSFSATPIMHIEGETEQKNQRKFLVIFSYYREGTPHVCVYEARGDEELEVKFKAWKLFDDLYPDCKGCICRQLIVLPLSKVKFLDI